MSGQIFCGRCGAPNDSEIRFCTTCGTRFDTIIPPSPIPPSGDAVPMDPAVKTPPPSAPHTLADLIRFVVTTTIRNIRGTVKMVIKGMIIAFAIVFLINILLQVTDLGQSDIAQSVLTGSGLNSSPDTQLFWFLFMAILAFFWSQLMFRGVRSTFGKLATIPRWIGNSLKTTGITAFPLFMAGIAAALIVRLYWLTPLTSIQFLVLMGGILYSQQESIAVLALSLGYSDITRILTRSGPDIPPLAFPVMGVAGAAFGFLLVLFFADTVPIIVAAIILLIVSSFIIRYRKRSGSAGLKTFAVLIDCRRRWP